MVNPLLEAALRYADIGYAVHPCHPGEKRPILKGWQELASVDPEQIEKWWTEYPAANIGIPTKHLLVVDIDGRDNPWTPDLPPCPISLTPHDGRHHFYRQPEGVLLGNSGSKLAPMVDTRGNGGFVVAPPSIINGVPYQWAQECPLLPLAGLEVVPDWIVKILLSDNPDDSINEDAIPKGRRNHSLAQWAGAMRRRGMSERGIYSGIMAENEARCKPPLPSSEVRIIARSIAKYPPNEVARAVAEGTHLDYLDDDPRDAVLDPGPLPEHLLRVPGFISEVMDYCLATAPYPNQAMAFCGALTLQAVLSGRKVRESFDCRTNLFILGLAHSGAGKDHPRKITSSILGSVGLSQMIANKMASGEGIEDKLYLTPCTLFQTDEIDGMLQSINKAKDARHESLMNMMLSIYGSANTTVTMRAKAGMEASGTINQPHMVLFGTAIPKHYYEALSERMLTNGFFARMMIFESKERGAGQRPSLAGIPERILETASYWANYKASPGNLQHQNPTPSMVEESYDVGSLPQEIHQEADRRYNIESGKNDEAGMAVWARVHEHVRKMALCYALSKDYRNPVIGREALQWASELVFHQADRMMYQARLYVSNNPHDKEALRVLRIIQGAKVVGIGHSDLMRKSRLDAKTLASVTDTLKTRRDIEIKEPTVSKTAIGRPGKRYVAL